MSNSSSLFKARMALILALGAVFGLLLGGILAFPVWIMIILGVLGFVSLVSALISLQAIENLATKVSQTCRSVAAGDFEARIHNIKEGGSLGELLYAINDLIDVADAYIRESAASMERVSEHKFFRLIREEGLQGSYLHAARQINSAVAAMREVEGRISGMAVDLDGRVSGKVGDIVTIANKILERAHKMSHRMEQSSTRSIDVSKASQRTTEAVAMVSDATTQLSSSVREIASQVSKSTIIASEAVNKADVTNKLVTELTEASQKIGDVVNLITDIASQTNLLALNATIEAARAGDAGKGFAVVAGEVKNLANQTQKATGEIAEQISGIQHAVSEAGRAVNEITGIIDKIGDIISVIAAAVEEQEATTSQIATNMQGVSSDANIVSQRITKVTQASAVSFAAAIQVIWAAKDLVKPAQVLDEEVHTFLKELKS